MLRDVDQLSITSEQNGQGRFEHEDKTTILSDISNKRLVKIYVQQENFETSELLDHNSDNGST